MTHGYSWARFGVLQTRNVPGFDDDPGAARRARLSASLEDVMSFVEVSAIILNRAWEMHRLRRSVEPPAVDDGGDTRVGVLPDPSIVAIETATRSADPLGFWRRPGREPGRRTAGP